MRMKAIHRFGGFGAVGREYGQCIPLSVEYVVCNVVFNVVINIVLFTKVQTIDKREGQKRFFLVSMYYKMSVPQDLYTVSVLKCMQWENEQ